MKGNIVKPLYWAIATVVLEKNSNIEARNPKQIQNHKFECPKNLVLNFAHMKIRICFEFRISKQLTFPVWGVRQ
jgi:hypothetical protein